MATRWYLQSSGAPGVEQAFSASWDDVGPAARRSAATTKGATATANLQGGGSGAGAANVLLGQFVSPALAAQTISGTVKGQALTRRIEADTNARAQLVIRVMGPDGTTVRGTLVAAHSEALSSEWATTFTNRKFPLAALAPLTVTNVDAQEGDFLVIELGARVDDNGLDEVTIRIGDDQASDLAEDETSTGAANPWIEFSADIALQVVGALAPSGGLDLGMGL